MAKLRVRNKHNIGVLKGRWESFYKLLIAIYSRKDADHVGLRSLREFDTRCATYAANRLKIEHNFSIVRCLCEKGQNYAKNRYYKCANHCG